MPTLKTLSKKVDTLVKTQGELLGAYRAQATVNKSLMLEVKCLQEKTGTSDIEMSMMRERIGKVLFAEKKTDS